MGWITTKLGPIGNETTISFKKSSFSISAKDIKAESQNIQGDYRKSIFKVNVPSISITGTKLTQTEVNTFTSLKYRAAILNFIYRDDLAVIDQATTSTSTTTIKLINGCETGITITGVWLATDTAHSGTNYYTSGSFNATTRIITLGSALPSTYTNVLISFTYTGLAVTITGFDCQALQGLQSANYSCNMTLEGA